MSKTYNTNKARKERILTRKLIDVRNTGNGGENKIRSEIHKLEVAGIRYGNQRKYRALIKVKARRGERHRKNHTSLDE